MGTTISKGITLKENGKYLARKRIGDGKRISKEFNSLAEAKSFLEESSITTLSDFFVFWIETLMVSLRVNSKLSYINKYDKWIRPVIGDMDITKIKPMDCMKVLVNCKNDGRKNSTIGTIRRLMHLIFDYALENGFVTSNPVNKTVKITNCENTTGDVRFLSRDEQRAFLDEAVKHTKYNQFAFVLQTGLRYSELTGLKWSDIDGRFLHVNRAGYYVGNTHEFVTGEPKTKNGYRTIYLTDEALKILSDEKKISKKTSMYDSDFIFLDKNGKPITRSAYDKLLRRIADIMGVEKFSIHKLRHTFATRCVEAGMKPKTLQKLLGHSDVTITLNYYVHVTDNELISEMDKFSSLVI